MMLSEDTSAVGTVGSSLLEPRIETHGMELLLAHFTRFRRQRSENSNSNISRMTISSQQILPHGCYSHREAKLRGEPN